MEVHHYGMSHPTSMQEGGDRFPQWSLHETREFLAIRAELDRTFMETKRNKLLWDVISSKMKEKGFNRSAEQCKCKWKNLVTRYKGSEAMETDQARQFPFYDELRGIFSARMQRLLWLEAEGGASSSARKKGMQSSSEDEEESNDGSEIAGGKVGKEKKKKKKKSSKGKGMDDSKVGRGSSPSSVMEALEEFMRQQMQMEAQWREAMEAREEERRTKEMEWWQTMEALQRERLLMDSRWREREEQRRMREEARAEKRDALLTTLLNKLINDDM